MDPFQVILLAPKSVRCLLNFFNRRVIAFPFNIIKTKPGVSNPVCYDAARVMDTLNTNV
jgi:hypothetical protein